ncbi:MAG: acetyl-CoA carboxylase carboxyltransferase subunit alpha [Raoultibacter sp.]
MKRQKQRSYITIPRQPIKPELVGGITTEELFASVGTNIGGLGQAAVSYGLDTIAQAHGRALLVACGNEAKSAVRACRDAGLEAWVTYTADRADAAYVSLAKHTICLGSAYSEALYGNDYAVLQAAQDCGATAILFASATHLGDSKGFLSLAKAQGCTVFRVLDSARPTGVWLIGEAKAVTDDHAWKKCPHCDLFFDASTWRSNHFVCPACAGHHRMSSMERINDVFDAASFIEWENGLSSVDPLSFPGYLDKLQALQKTSGLEEAVRCGSATIAGIRFAFCIMDSQFLMGSMGSIVGEKITRTVERATGERLPLLIFTASGGARMQEGLASLMQMAKVSCALERHGAAGLLYISVLTDPTTGGVTASFAMQGDIILAEPKALVGFAGQRVIKDTIKQSLPEGFQTAEFALEHGLIDAIVDRDELRFQLANILAIHEASSSRCGLEDGHAITYAAVCENLQHDCATYNTITYARLPQIRRVLFQASQKFKPAFRRSTKDTKPFSPAAFADATAAIVEQESGDGRLFPEAPTDGLAWESVQLARNTRRPTSLFYVNRIVDGFVELHGDRAFGDDGAIVCGIGWIGTTSVTVIAQEKGCDVKQRVARNFGCPQPEGYRKSLRLMRQAEKFGRPIVCLVDTQGAFCGMEAEQRGQGNAIADNLIVLAGLRVPLVSVIVGEGGSGGALALALSDRVAMQEHAVYSVLSPEGFASILWKDRKRAPEAATAMKMSAPEVLAMGVVDAVISEGEAPAHENPDMAAACVRGYLVKALGELSVQSVDQLLANRYDRFRKF